MKGLIGIMEWLSAAGAMTLTLGLRHASVYQFAIDYGGLAVGIGITLVFIWIWIKEEP